MTDFSAQLLDKAKEWGMTRVMVIGETPDHRTFATTCSDDGWIKGMLEHFQQYDYAEGSAPKMRDDATPPDMIGTNGLKMICSLAQSTPPGCFVEVGVYKGGSAWHLARVARTRRCDLHLFDTFTGIPFQGALDKMEVGHFSDTSAEAVQKSIPDAIIHVGLFPSTLPAGLRDIAFAHIDCDQYESVKSCIETLWPLMVPGGIMYFDDYGWLDGATKAVDEYFGMRVLPGDHNRVYAVKT